MLPNNWKNAIVKPLFKKLSVGPVDTNYRPVSNLKYFAKVLECVVIKQITHHCESNKLLPCHQSAYRKNFSCETMLLKLSDIILNNMEHQQITSVTACDLSAAFDTSYLNGRSCQVVVNGTYSEKRDLTLSVPQGGCGSAFYFIMYAATLLEEISDDINCFGFADDHILNNHFEPNSRLAEANAAVDMESCLAMSNIG